jgi:predicted esterase
MEHKIQISKTATYHTIGNIKTAKTIWFVLHGYGMLAEFFLRKFNTVLTETTCIIAPEGLSRFYNKGFNGRVGATWMTKKDREDEITDYINYLNQLYEIIIKENIYKKIKINVLGFSQGGATASRWVANGKICPNNFILWSSTFPDEINLTKFGKLNSFLLHGNKDKFIPLQEIQEKKSFLKASPTNVEFIEFNGTHDIPKEVLIEQTLKNNWE